MLWTFLATSGESRISSTCGSFFPHLLNLGFALGMLRVRGHLAPTVPGQKPADHRWFDSLAKLLCQGRPNRGNDHQIAGSGAFEPRL
jgi:hypothetical protein